MLIFTLTDSKSRKIHATDLAAFAEKYRKGSFRPEDSMEEFMRAVAHRAKELGFEISCNSREDFVVSLIETGFVALEYKGNS